MAWESAMRVENVDFIKSIPQKQQPYGLKQGEMMVCEVVEVKGQAVLLRNQIGVTLTARILGDLSVFTGDFVETVVDQAGNGRYVLRVLDISRPDTLGQTAVA